VADTIQAIKNITFLEAKKNIQILLNKESLTINDKKKLLFNYLGTTDLPSAALQYQYINNKSIFTTEFEKYIVHIIEKNIATHSEYYSLAVSLAKRENINQLQPIDNIQDESLLYKYYPDFIEDYKKHSDKLNKINQLPVYQKFNQLIKESIQANDLSKLYEFLNSDDYKTQDYNGQWSIWLKTNFPSGSDRARYSLWEMRNLQITANIMKVVARNPGKKILIIIGASHRGFLEEYLKQMEDVEVMKYE
jgi:pheromone shutdown protein TraB